MNNVQATPAERVKLLIDEDMADTVARLKHQRELLDLINGCFGLKRELGLPDKSTDEGE